jgi:hypothetical protein
MCTNTINMPRDNWIQDVIHSTLTTSSAIKDDQNVSSLTSGKRAFGQDPLVPASIWAGTKGPATSPESRQPPGRL